MDIRIISDLHIDINKDYPISYNDDVFTVIAGDICGNPYDGVEWVKNNIKHGLFIKGNHCLIPGTEVLTDIGFKPIETITVADKVYQYNKGYCELVNPTRVIKTTSDKFIEFKCSQFHQIVTEEHRMCMSDGSFILAKDLLNKDLYSKDFTLTAKTQSDKDYDISDDLLRFLVWIVSDATIVLGDRALSKCDTFYLNRYKNGEINKTRIQFHLSKQRKIKALEALLNKLGFSYTLNITKKCGCNILQPYFLRVYSEPARLAVKLLNYKKEFPAWFLQLSKRQLDIVLETLLITDGFQDHKQIRWVHTSKNDTDIMQSLCARYGYLFTYKSGICSSGFKSKNPKLQYYCKIKNKDFKQVKVFINQINKLSDAYCLTVPSGAFIIRYKGITSVTGNCVYHNLHLFFQEIPSIYSNAFPIDADVSFLENQYKIIDDIVFIGCTLYTDYKYGGNQYNNMIMANRGLNDFRYGMWFDEKTHCLTPLQPQHYLKLHEKSRRFISNTLKKFKDKKCVLITHHGMSPKCIADEYVGNYLNASYVSNMERLIKSNPNLVLVISGHIHASKDFMVGNTRYIMNPYGYRNPSYGIVNTAFNSNLIVSV